MDFSVSWETVINQTFPPPLYFFTIKIYVTIRKSEAKLRDPANNLEAKVESEDATNTPNNVVPQAAFDRLKSDFEDSLAEIEAKNEYISKLEAVLSNSDEKLSKLED